MDHITSTLQAQTLNEIPTPGSKRAADTSTDSASNPAHRQKSGSKGPVDVRAILADKRRGPHRKDRQVKKWTLEEDQLLRDAVTKHGAKNWKLVASCVSGRDHTQCLQRWSKCLAPGLRKGTWTLEEDTLLTKCVNDQKEIIARSDQKSKKIPWGEVCKYIEGRTAKQCRERWVNNLDPVIYKGVWTKEEDDRMKELYKKYGPSWAAIAKEMEGRTENGVKIRWKALARTKEGQAAVAAAPAPLFEKPSKSSKSSKSHGAASGSVAGSRAISMSSSSSTSVSSHDNDDDDDDDDDDDEDEYGEDGEMHSNDGPTHSSDGPNGSIFGRNLASASGLPHILAAAASQQQPLPTIASSSNRSTASVSSHGSGSSLHQHLLAQQQQQQQHQIPHSHAAPALPAGGVLGAALSSVTGSATGVAGSYFMPTPAGPTGHFVTTGPTYMYPQVMSMQPLSTPAALGPFNVPSGLSQTSSVSGGSGGNRTHSGASTGSTSLQFEDTLRMLSNVSSSSPFTSVPSFYSLPPSQQQSQQPSMQPNPFMQQQPAYFPPPLMQQSQQQFLQQHFQQEQQQNLANDQQQQQPKKALSRTDSGRSGWSGIRHGGQQPKKQSATEDDSSSTSSQGSGTSRASTANMSSLSLESFASASGVKRSMSKEQQQQQQSSSGSLGGGSVRSGSGQQIFTPQQQQTALAQATFQAHPPQFTFTHPQQTFPGAQGATVYVAMQAPQQVPLIWVPTAPGAVQSMNQPPPVPNMPQMLFRNSMAPGYMPLSVGTTNPGTSGSSGTQ